MSHDFPEEDDLVVPRRVDWRLWRRILGHLRPYPKAVAMMIGGGSILAGTHPHTCAKTATSSIVSNVGATQLMQ